MIEFYTLIPELIETMPIIPSKEYRYDWYNVALENLKKDKDKVNVARCPGIIDVNTRGWIQRTYQDVYINVDNNKKVISLESEKDQTREVLGDYLHNYLYELKPFLLADHRKGHQFSMDSMIKICSPWRVKIPEGYSLFSFPIPYPDDQRFTAASGILRGDNSLNVQLFWHGPYGTLQFIPKGTPIQQYILIKDDNTNFTVRNYTSMDMENIQRSGG